MVPENVLTEFVRRMREAAGSNLESIILYGSAAAGDFRPEFSDLNLFCVLRETTLTSLRAIAPVARWWESKRQPPMLLMTRTELERSTDVFTIELLDMKQHHRVLYGADLVADLNVPMDLHRVQVEYELREKLLVLRQKAVLTAGDKTQSWKLLTQSVSSFVTLFRHALIALGAPASSGKHEVVRALAERTGFIPGIVEQVLEIREGKRNPKDMNLDEIFEGYLKVIEQVAAAVDQALGAGGALHS